MIHKLNVRWADQFFIFQEEHANLRFVFDHQFGDRARFADVRDRHQLISQGLGGQTVVELLSEAGQILVQREITPDEPSTMTAVIPRERQIR